MNHSFIGIYQNSFIILLDSRTIFLLPEIRIAQTYKSSEHIGFNS
ncbi:hypothetical protein ES703_68928 [subsurface metagenome]